MMFDFANLKSMNDTISELEAIPKRRGKVKQDLSGKRFGKWSVIEHVGNGNWKCRCDCGRESVCIGRHLKNGDSNGCYPCSRIAMRKEHTKATYAVWRNMMQRCYNPKAYRYDRYGGRGIRVCNGWHIFQNFFLDMGNPPHRHTLERIDNDGDYAPGNCKWATWEEQHRNKTTTRFVTLNNQRMVLADAAKVLNKSAGGLTTRLKSLGNPDIDLATLKYHKSYKRKPNAIK